MNIRYVRNDLRQ